jgi:hypothetical protein
MNKQIVKLGSMLALLVVCVLGYFFVNNYYENKEKEEDNANTEVVFSLNDYKNTKSVSYVYNSKTIKLSNDGDQWTLDSNKKLDIDEDVVESEMLAQLAEVSSSEKIEDADNLEDYGFTKKKKKITPSTNTISITDSEGNKHTIYIGNLNPYDSTMYYMMIKGDDNVYVVDSTLAEAFSKSTDDLEKEEETTTAAE